MTILLFKALLRRCDSFGLKSILACPLALLLAGAIAQSMPLDGEIPAVLPLLFNEGETDYLPDAERQQNLSPIAQSGQIQPVATGKAMTREGAVQATSSPITDRNRHSTWCGDCSPKMAENEADAHGAEISMFPWEAWHDVERAWCEAAGLAIRIPRAIPDMERLSQLPGNVREWLVAESGPVLKGGNLTLANPTSRRVVARRVTPSAPTGIDLVLRWAHGKETW